MDISKPEYGKEQDFSLECAVTTKLTLDIWLEQDVMEVLMEANLEVDKVMRNILEKQREFHWESKAMKYQMMAQLYKHEQQNCW